MTLVEKEITQNNVELANNNPELVKRREIETKLRVTNAAAFEALKESANQIDAVYLSNPTDEFSLRVRREETGNGAVYSATLKDRGETINGAKHRLEITVNDLSKDAYEYYASQSRFTPLTQYRAQLSEEVTIDFIEGHDPIIEIETNDTQLRREIVESFNDVTRPADSAYSLDKEWIAHHLNGKEALQTPESLDSFADRVVQEIIARYTIGKQQVVTGLTGMSGSGKTTVTRAIEDRIVELFGESYKPLIISTDDYHFGKTALEEKYGAPWTEWDDPRTYNTAELANDIALLAEGTPLIRRHFDFITEEPAFDDTATVSPFIIIEGLYAGSKDLDAVRDLHFHLPTSIATSIGRDVRRLVIENRANRVFPTPESRLKYQLETALPLFLDQEQPPKNSFSACARPLAERAFMLTKATELQSYS